VTGRCRGRPVRPAGRVPSTDRRDAQRHRFRGSAVGRYPPAAADERPVRAPRTAV